jgi:hypothetical protein
VSKTEIYSALPEYKGKKVIGINKIINIPFFPIKNVLKEQIEILRIIDNDNFNSIEELILRIRPDLNKNSREYSNERARLSHHLRGLRQEKFIDYKKSGKNVKIRISEIGRIYLKGREIST